MDLSHLNVGQRAAVSAPDGVQLVVAGAGTGKTRTLVHRVAWLVDQGVHPRDIVLLTFTRRAANEMLERVSDLVGHAAQAVRGGTFHSFAVQALRKHAQHLGYTRDFTILDRGDAETLVGLVRSELGLGGSADKRFPQRRTVLKLISKQINTGRPMIELIEQAYPQYAENCTDIQRIADRFIDRKQQQNVMDFDDLLVKLVELLRNHERPRQELAGEIRYLLVDEYQDTNRIQAEISGLLSYVHGNLMVVGDEVQSIYAFRGADVRNILHFQELFPSAQLLRLEQNYRSTQPVLDLANGVLDSALEGYDKSLFTEVPGGDKPVLVEVADEHEQADYVAGRVLGLREDGVPLQDIAVLFRSGFHANLVELELARRNIPFKKFGGIQFVEAAHVKDVFALLRLVANPRDLIAWVRALQWFEGLGAKTAESIAQQIVESANPVLDAGPYRKRKYGGALAYFAGVLEDAAPMTDDPELLVDHLVEFYKPLMERLFEDHRKRARDLETLSVLASRYDDLETFLADVALDPPGSAEVNGTDDEDEWMTLSTIHSAKGLEWGTVIVLQLGDGSFPAGQSLDDDTLMEEERRLLYVAVTRAKRTLELIQPRFVRRSFASSPGCALLDTIPELEDRVETLRWRPAAPPPADKHPDIAAAEARLATFLSMFDKKK